MGMIEIKKGLIILLVTSLIILNQQNDDTQYIKKLIDKIDSTHIKEREEALNKLKELAKNDKKVLEILRTESENETNSYNTRFFLKRLIKEIEKQEEKSREEEQITKEKQDDKENTNSPLQKFFQGFKNKISVTFCTNNNCKSYEASSCKELLQKYPELRGKINCGNNGLSLKWGNGVKDSIEDIKKRLRRFRKGMLKDIVKKQREWEKRFKKIIGGGNEESDEEDSDTKPPKKMMGKEYRHINWGFDMEDLTEEELRNLNIDNGVRIKNVQKDGFGASDLKLQENDIIISINGEKMDSKWKLKRQLKMFLKEGDIREMEIMRNGKIQKLTY